MPGEEQTTVLGGVEAATTDDTYPDPPPAQNRFSRLYGGGTQA